MKSLMKGGSQWGSNKTMVNSRNTSTLNTKLLILGWNCPCLPVLHHIPTNGLLLCPMPVHMNLSRFYFFETAHYLACREAGVVWKYASMHASMFLNIYKVCMYIRTYVGMYMYACMISMYLLMCYYKGSDGTTLQAIAGVVASLVPKLFVSGGFPWWYRISYSLQNE